MATRSRPLLVGSSRTRIVAIGYVVLLACVLLATSVVTVIGLLFSGWGPEALLAPIVATVAVALLPIVVIRSWLP